MESQQIVSSMKDKLKETLRDKEEITGTTIAYLQ